MKWCSCITTGFILVVCTISTVAAWSDGGRLLVAAVARLQLDEKQIKVLEAPLKEWDSQFPGNSWLSDLANASVGMHQFRCMSRGAYCGGRPDHLTRIFTGWNYVYKPYNPQNIPLTGLNRFLPLPGTGAVWALTTLLAGIPEVGSTGAVSSRSVFSWNLRLRLLLNIFPDLHQPLHAIKTFSRQHPEGDNRGASVDMDLSTSKIVREDYRINSLLGLWYSCGGRLPNFWPRLSEQDIQKKAEKLIADYPPTHFGAKLKISDFGAIADESFEIAKTVVYKEMNWTSDYPYGLQYNKEGYRSEWRYYKPSEEYLKTVLDVCMGQIALGGYRLAEILKDLAKRMPDVTAVHTG